MVQKYVVNRGTNDLDTFLENTLLLSQGQPGTSGRALQHLDTLHVDTFLSILR